MPQFIIPQSFIGKPYAEKHFIQIVNHAFEHNPFYRHFYASSTTIPLLTREILQKHNDELLNGNPVTGKTSGSTSVPVRTYWSPRRAQLDAQDSQSYAEWFGGRLPHTKIIALSAHQAKSNYFEVASPVVEQLAFLQTQIEQGARSLISYPTNLEQLSQYLFQKNEPITEIHRIICMSELFESSQEALINRAFPNAVIGSTYSSTEVGMTAGRCPHHPENYHIMAHKLGVEFLNDQGQPCQNGEVGQIVITDYFNQKMPFIRYAIGDLAAPTICPCGKIPLPALTKLLGKSRGLLKHPNGGFVFSTELSAPIRDTPGIRQYQVQQTALDQFLVRVIAQESANKDSIESSVSAVFSKHFGVSTAVSFDWCDEIPRLPGGKYMEFIGL
jgi:phenylacetate-coenzyme A ligase PaaK-like adenylate-forming protein